MSATNRGSERKLNDFYATPIDCVENFIDKYSGKIEGDILEPSAGNGNIIKALRNKNIKGNIMALELREEEYESLNKISDELIITDFLQWETDRKFDIIIGNPPFTYAKEFVEKCLGLLSDNGKLIFLLRTAFLESKSRYEFWQQNPLGSLYVLSKRPSFINGKTDATSYSWFVWDKSTNKQEIKVI
jgi:16S rRNA G1207 methylase RsmC